MYTVSQSYKEAMHAADTQHRITGFIDNVPFSNDDTLEGSVSISNRCSGDEEINIGYVNIGELNATFRHVNIAKKTWQGRVIKPTAWLLVDQTNDIWEDVPIGEFTIDSVMHTQSGVVVKAYDNMHKLKKTCSMRFTNATPFDMLTFACTECGVQFGNTPAEIAVMPNGNEVFTQYPESDIETWQDMVYWIAQTLAGFATAGRDGKIYIRQYNQNIVDTLGSRERHEGCYFSDFETKYTGISVVNVIEESTTYYGMETDNALTYNLGNNPFLQYGSKEQIEDRCRAILEALQMIDYTPFESSMIGDPAYDLGDVVRFRDGIADGTKVCCMTSYTYNFHGQYTMSGAGKDPATRSAKSKTDKNIDGLINKVNKDTYRQDVIANGREQIVEDGQTKRILRASILTKPNAQIKADIEILTDVILTEGESKAIGAVTYQLDSDILQRKPVETWIEGKHILTLQLVLAIEEPGLHVLDIFMKMSGGSVEIGQYDIQCIFSGIGIAAESGFNGRIEIEEAIEDGFSLHNITIGGEYAENVVAFTQTPLSITLTETAEGFTLHDITLGGSYIDEVMFGDSLADYTWGDAYNYTWGVAYDTFHWGRYEEGDS